MNGKPTSQRLKITFHNPNSPEETAKYLIKIIAENLADYIINKNTVLARKD